MEPGTLVTTVINIKLSYPENLMLDSDSPNWCNMKGRDDIPFERYTLAIVLEARPSVLGSGRFWLKVVTSRGGIGMCFSDEVIEVL